MFVNPEFVQDTAQIGTIIGNEELYRNYPTYQRRYRAPRRYRQRLIDSILRGYPIPALMAYRVIGDDGAQRYEIIDGKQRLESILSYVRGEFSTSTQNFDGQKPVYPGKKYRDLPAEGHNRFRTYLLRFQVWLNVDPAVHGDVFRRIGESMALTKAEKVMTYDTEQNARAERIAKHTWIQGHLRLAMLDKSIDHYLALCLLMMHSSPDRVASLNTETVANFARGASGSEAIRGDLGVAEKATIRTLNALLRLASDVESINLGKLVLLVLAVGVLDARNMLDAAKDDCLTRWLAMVEQSYADTVTGQRRMMMTDTMRTATQQVAMVERYAPLLLSFAEGRRAA